jgi:hypothetical protein
MVRRREFSHETAICHCHMWHGPLEFSATAWPIPTQRNHPFKEADPGGAWGRQAAALSPSSITR